MYFNWIILTVNILFPNLEGEMGGASFWWISALLYLNRGLFLVIIQTGVLGLTM